MSTPFGAAMGAPLAFTIARLHVYQIFSPTQPPVRPPRPAVYVVDRAVFSKTLSICVSLCESGVNPEALAAVVKELKRESQAMRVS